jgi:hypothetical protein
VPTLKSVMQVLTTANLNILRDLHLITGVSVSVWMQKWHVERQKAFIASHREMEEKEKRKAQTRHTARLCNAKRSRTRNPRPTHGARDRPKQPQPGAGRDRASEPGRRHAARRTRPTDTGTRLQRETEKKARQPKIKQLHEHATQQGYATQSEAKPETSNPHTGQETGKRKLLYAPEAAPDRVTDLVLDLRDLLLGGVVVHRWEQTEG